MRLRQTDFESAGILSMPDYLTPIPARPPGVGPSALLAVIACKFSVTLARHLQSASWLYDDHDGDVLTVLRLIPPKPIPGSQKQAKRKKRLDGRKQANHKNKQYVGTPQQHYARGPYY